MLHWRQLYHNVRRERRDDRKDRSGAHEALMNYQQADMDGIMVLVSRQAIHEVDEELRALSAALKRAEQERDAIVAAAFEEATKTDEHLREKLTESAYARMRSAQRGIRGQTTTEWDGIESHLIETYSEHIRALTPDDAREALEKVKRDERERCAKVERLAICMMAAQEGEGVADWFKKWEPQFRSWAVKDHDGDCTNQPYTCMRCVYENMVKEAHDVLRLFASATRGDDK